MEQLCRDSEHSSTSSHSEFSDFFLNPETHGHEKLPILFSQVSKGPLHASSSKAHSSMSVQFDVSLSLRKPEVWHSQVKLPLLFVVQTSKGPPHWHSQVKLPSVFLQTSKGLLQTVSDSLHSSMSWQSTVPDAQLLRFENPEKQEQSNPLLRWFKHKPLGPHSLSFSRHSLMSRKEESWV